MNRAVALFSSEFMLAASLIAGTLPIAAQAESPCSLISDEVLSQTLGTPTHAVSVISGTAPTSGGLTLADMCFAESANQNVLLLTHMLGVQASGDVPWMLNATQGTSGSLGLEGKAADAASLTAAPISNLGDSAVLLSGGSGSNTYANLIVWRGTEAFSIAGADLPDPGISLTSLAHTMLTAQPTHFI